MASEKYTYNDIVDKSVDEGLRVLIAQLNEADTILKEMKKNPIKFKGVSSGDLKDINKNLELQRKLIEQTEKAEKISKLREQSERKLNEELNKRAKNQKTLSDNIENAIKVEKSLADQIKNTNDKEKEYQRLIALKQEKLKNIAKLHGKTSDAYLDEAREISNLRKRTRELVKEQEKQIKESNVLKSSQKGLEIQLTKLINKYKSLSAAQRNSEGGKAMLNQIRALDKEVKKLDATIGRHQRNVGNYKSALGGIGNGLNTLVSAFSPVTLGLGTLALGMKKVVEIQKEFEANMSIVKAITGATGDQFNELSNLAKEMGATTKFTATQASDGMIQLGRAGFNTNEILAALPSTLTLAAAGGIELGEAADIASNVLAGFGMSASETGRIADILAKSANTANVTISSMGESFKEIASTAAILNVPVEEIGSLINTLGNAGIKGTNATNTLRSSIQRLSDPTKDMRAEMNKLNLEFFDSNGEFIGMINTIELLENRFKGLTKEQQLAAVSSVFGKQSSNQWLTALNSTKDVIVEDMNPATRELLNLTEATGTVTLKGSEVLKFYTSELQNASGAASEMARIMQDNLQGDLLKAQSAIEGLALSTGEGLNPILRRSIQGFTEFIGYLKLLFDNSKPVIEAWNEIADVFRELFNEIGNLLKQFDFFETKADSAKTAMNGLALVFKISSIPLKLVITLMAFVANSINKFIGLIKDVPNIWSGFISAAVDTFKRFKNLVFNTFKGVVDVISESFNFKKIITEGLSGFDSALNRLKSNFTNFSLDMSSAYRKGYEESRKISEENNAKILESENEKNKEILNSIDDLNKKIIINENNKVKEIVGLSEKELKKREEILKKAYELRRKYGLISDEQAIEDEIDLLKKSSEFAILTDAEKNIIIANKRAEIRQKELDKEKKFEESKNKVVEQLQKQGNESYREELNKIKEDESLTFTERLVALSDFHNARKDSNDVDFKERIDIESEYWAAITEVAAEGIGKVNQKIQTGYDAISSLRDSEISLEKARQDELILKVEQRLNAGNISEQQAQEEKERIKQEGADREKRIAKRYADFEFAAKVAQIIASTASAIGRQFADLPYPAALITSALVAASGAIQISVANRERQKVKALAKGEVDIKDGSGRKDDVPALLWKGESVSTVNSTKRLKNTLIAGNKDVSDNQLVHAFIKDMGANAIQMLGGIIPIQEKSKQLNYVIDNYNNLSFEKINNKLDEGNNISRSMLRQMNDNEYTTDLYNRKGKKIGYIIKKKNKIRKILV